MRKIKQLGCYLCLCWLINLSGLFAQESSRIEELNRYWENLSRTVQKGDDTAYAAAYHPDAAVVNLVANPQNSKSIAQAMEGWRPGFQETQAGKAKSKVDFRFSSRVGDEKTAYEIGIFHYTQEKDGTVVADVYIDFEMLLVKKEGQWLALMELQRSMASKEAWNALAE